MNQLHVQFLKYRMVEVKIEKWIISFEKWNFLWGWEKIYRKKVCMFHDGDVFHSRIGSSDWNLQFTNRKQKVIAKSTAEWNLFYYLQSSTDMEIFAREHTSCNGHYNDVDIIENYTVLKAYGAMSIENWIEILLLITEILTKSSLYISGFDHGFSVGGIQFVVKMQDRLKYCFSHTEALKNQLPKLFFAENSNHV